MDSFENQMKDAIIYFTYNLAEECEVIMDPQKYIHASSQKVKNKRLRRNTEVLKKYSHRQAIYTMVKHQGFYHTVFNLREVPMSLTILSQISPEPPQGLLPPQIHRVLEHGQQVKQKLYDDFHLPPSKRK